MAVVTRGRQLDVAEQHLFRLDPARRGIAWSGPKEVTAKVNQNLKAFSSLQSYK